MVAEGLRDTGTQAVWARSRKVAWLGMGGALGLILRRKRAEGFPHQLTFPMRWETQLVTHLSQMGKEEEARQGHLPGSAVATTQKRPWELDPRQQCWQNRVNNEPAFWLKD